MSLTHSHAAVDALRARQPGHPAIDACASSARRGAAPPTAPTFSLVDCLPAQRLPRLCGNALRLSLPTLTRRQAAEHYRRASCRLCAGLAPQSSTRLGAPAGRRLGPQPSLGAAGRRSWMPLVAFTPCLWHGSSGATPLASSSGRPLCASRAGTLFEGFGVAFGFPLVLAVARIRQDDTAYPACRQCSQCLCLTSVAFGSLSKRVPAREARGRGLRPPRPESALFAPICAAAQISWNRRWGAYFRWGENFLAAPPGHSPSPLGRRGSWCHWREPVAPTLDLATVGLSAPGQIGVGPSPASGAVRAGFAVLSLNTRALLGIAAVALAVAAPFGANT